MTWVYMGGFVIGALFLLYQYAYHAPNSHSAHRNDTRYRDDDDDDIDYNGRPNPDPSPARDATRPKRRTESPHSRHRPKLPAQGDVCPVCLDPLYRNAGRKYCILPLPRCDHWLHHKCALRLLDYHPSCPVCRTPIDSSELSQTPVLVHEDRRPADGPSSSTQSSRDYIDDSYDLD